MSYDVHLYREEVKENYEKNNSDNFFEDENNLLAFSPDKKEEIKERLLNYDYVIDSEKDGHISFSHADDDSQSVLLTNHAVYFSTTGDIFDITMTASEFTDDGYLAKYDPQNGCWEEEE